LLSSGSHEKILITTQNQASSQLYLKERKMFVVVMDYFLVGVSRNKKEKRAKLGISKNANIEK